MRIDFTFVAFLPKPWNPSLTPIKTARLKLKGILQRPDQLTSKVPRPLKTGK